MSYFSIWDEVVYYYNYNRRHMKKRKVSQMLKNKAYIKDLITKYHMSEF